MSVNPYLAGLFPGGVPLGLQLGQIQVFAFGTRSNFGDRQNVWNPLSHPSHMIIFFA